MEVYLIRHTTPDVAQGICYGQTDLEVTASFEQEKKQVLDQLPDGVEAVYSSPLKRCRILANEINRTPLLIDQRLMELNFGDWEMKDWNDIERPALDKWMNDFVYTAPPNGESMIALQKRVIEWLEEVKSLDLHKIAVVTHAGVIRVLFSLIQGFPLEEAFSKVKIEYGQLLQVNL